MESLSSGRSREEEMAIAMKIGIRVKRGIHRGAVAAVFNVEGGTGRRCLVNWDTANVNVFQSDPKLYKMGEDGSYELEIIRFVKSCIDDKYHIEKKIHPEKNLNEDMAIFMKSGLRVKPGSGWGYGGSNGNGEGTVTGHCLDQYKDKLWSVHWDGKEIPDEQYRMGGEYPKYDLEIIGFFLSTDDESHVKVTYSESLREEIEKYFKIGLRVKRGKHWRSGNNDGNGQEGAIVGTSKIGDKIRWKVKWDSEDSSSDQSYRMGDKIEEVTTVGFFKKNTENKFYYIQPAVPM